MSGGVGRCRGSVEAVSVDTGVGVSGSVGLQCRGSVWAVSGLLDSGDVPGKGGRVAPSEPDTLVETGAGITLLKESANHARRPPERPGKVPSALWVQKLDIILS